MKYLTKLTQFLKNQIIPCQKIIATTALASTALVSHTSSAQALNINFTYDLDVSFAYKQAAETAAEYWEDYLGDTGTINIHLDVASSSKLPQGVLGGAIPAFLNNVSYSSFRNALTTDRISSDDYTAVANLPTNYGYVNNYFDVSQFYLEKKADGTTGWFSANGVADSLNLTTANAKALGLINRYSSILDGTIVMNDLSNSSYSWEYYRTNTVNSWEFDLTTVLIHEIGHILGFVSGVDAINSTNIYNPYNTIEFITPQNLFSKVGYYPWSHSRANLDYGSQTYFSIDDGYTNLGYWSTGTDPYLSTDTYSRLADGWQASHFKDTYTEDLMNPALAPAMRRNVTTRDLRFLDVIGYNRNSKTYSDAQLANFGYNNALSKGNISNTTALNNMFNQYRWGGSSTTTTYAQNMDLADFLAQQGLFQQGTLWSTMPNQDGVTPVPESNSVMGLLGLGLWCFASWRKLKN